MRAAHARSPCPLPRPWPGPLVPGRVPRPTPVAASVGPHPLPCPSPLDRMASPAPSPSGSAPVSRCGASSRSGRTCRVSTFSWRSRCPASGDAPGTRCRLKMAPPGVDPLGRSSVENVRLAVIYPSRPHKRQTPAVRLAHLGQRGSTGEALSCRFRLGSDHPVSLWCATWPPDYCPWRVH